MDDKEKKRHSLSEILGRQQTEPSSLSSPIPLSGGSGASREWERRDALREYKSQKSRKSLNELLDEYEKKTKDERKPETTQPIGKIRVISEPMDGIKIDVETPDEKGSNETDFEIDTQKGIFIFTAPKRPDIDPNYEFVKWVVIRFYNDYPYERTSEKETIKINITSEHDFFLLRAVYVKKEFEKIQHSKQPWMKSLYQSGKLGGAEGGILRQPGIKSKIEFTDTLKPTPKDPHVNAAITKGKRAILGYAKAEYSRLFEPLMRNYKEEKEKLKKTKKIAEESTKKLKSIIDKNRSRLPNIEKIATRKLTKMDLVNSAEELLKEGGNADIELYKEDIENYIKNRDGYETNFKKDLESASAELRKYLEKKAEVVAVGMARRYRMPLNSDDEKAVDAGLKGYAEEIAEELIMKGRNTFFDMTTGLSLVSDHLSTGLSAYSNLMSSFWNLITGPWITGLLLVNFVYGFFIPTWMATSIAADAEVAFGLPLAWFSGIAGGLLVLFLNFSNSSPKDMFVHFLAGMLIFANMNIIFALVGWGNILSLPLTIYSYMASNWVLAMVAGISVAALFFFTLIEPFKYYQEHGFQSIAQITVLVLLIGYVAFGPYSAYYNSTLSQVKTPVKTGALMLQNAAGDTWMLATNPTEWYARQQIKNSRPDTPVSYPKALEIIQLDALPTSVPASTDSIESKFALVGVIRNDGEQDARNIKAFAGCINNFCEPNIIKNKDKDDIILDMEKAISVDVAGNREDRKLKPKEAEIVRITGMKAVKKTEARQAELGIAEAGFYLDYSYSTNASLFVETASEIEIDRRIREQSGDIFKNVVGLERVSPAKLSLNVGPQPLQYYSNPANDKANKALLLVAISNGRTDGNVVLSSGTELFINLPQSLGNGLDCKGINVEKMEKQTTPRIIGYETYKITLQKTQGTTTDEITIRPYNFNEILSFLCEFNINDVEGSKTHLIIAELPKFRFSVQKKVNIQITKPLGIIPTKEQKETMPESQPSVSTAGGSVIRRITTLARDLKPSISACLGLGVDQSVDQSIKEDLGDEESFEKLILQIASRETGGTFKHCKDGTLSCGFSNKDNIYQSGPDGNKDWGVMQINYKGNEFGENIFNNDDKWFTDGLRDGGKNLCIDKSQTVPICGSAETAYDMDCNIKTGIWQIVAKYIKYKSGFTGNIQDANSCDEATTNKYKSYKGWNAALRGYNGWKCQPKEIQNYVEDTKSRSVQLPEELISVFQGFKTPIPQLESNCNSDFGTDRGGERRHLGVDIIAPEATPVYAVYNGYVASVGSYNDGNIGGNRVWIKHELGDNNVWYSYYAHLKDVNVRQGSSIRQDTQIGTVGDTGNAKGTPYHLHLSIMKSCDGKIPDYNIEAQHIDPSPLCGSKNNAKKEATCS